MGGFLGKGKKKEETAPQPQSIDAEDLEGVNEFVNKEYGQPKSEEEQIKDEVKKSVHEQWGLDEDKKCKQK